MVSVSIDFDGFECMRMLRPVAKRELQNETANLTIVYKDEIQNIPMTDNAPSKTRSFIINEKKTSRQNHLETLNCSPIFR